MYFARLLKYCFLQEIFYNTIQTVVTYRNEYIIVLSVLAIRTRRSFNLRRNFEEGLPGFQNNLQ